MEWTNARDGNGGGKAVRVLCFCEKWESGGIEAFVTNVLTCMDCTDLEVDLAACIVQPGPYDARLAAVGIKPYALGTDLHAVGANLRAFARLIEERRYDVVHLNLYEGLALLFARAARRAGVPKVIVHSHNNDIRPGKLRWAKLALHRACVRLLGGYADERWAPSQTTASFLFGERPWTLVKNGIDVEAFAFNPDVRARVRDELGVGEQRVLGCVGRLCDQKNQVFLLGVLEKLDNAILLLVGEDDSDGRVGETLRRVAREKGILDRVIFLGGTRQPARYYQAMDVLCMPSLFEGLGIVAIEAQAAGLPVIASPAVPPEARVCDLFQTVELDAEAWAHKVGTLSKPNRSVFTDMVEKAGYGIQSSAAFVRRIYAGDVVAMRVAREDLDVPRSCVQSKGPLVSVVVPVYNVEPYLDECLSSIEHQTYSNLQIIVVDDSSPDGCGVICDAHARDDGRIEVIHRVQNGGLSQARNDGLDACRGEYIAFVDGDDAVAPCFIEELLAQKSDIAQCSFSTEREIIFAARGISPSVLDKATIVSGREASEALQYDSTGAYTVVWNKLYRRSLFDGMRFPVGKQHEDEYVTYRVLWNAASVALIPYELYWYRQRPQSTMSAGISSKSLDAIEALDQRTKFYQEQGEPYLSALSAAVECHRACSIIIKGKKYLPNRDILFAKIAARRSYRVVVLSDIGAVKKASVTVYRIASVLPISINGYPNEMLRGRRAGFS